MTATLLTLFVFLPPVQADAGAAVLVEEPYIDGSHGFSLRPPRGWSPNRERRFDRAGTTVLRLTHRPGPGAAWEIAVRQVIPPEPCSLDVVLDDVRRELTAELKSAELTDPRRHEVAGRPAASFSATVPIDRRPSLLFTCVIQGRPRLHFVLTCGGPAAARAELEPLFEAVVGSFRVLDDAGDDRTYRAALLAGADWLLSLRPGDLSRLHGAESHLLVTLDGRPVGLFQVRTEATHYGGRDGLAVRETGWTFLDDGTVRRIRNDMFISLDLHAERWQFRATTLTPATADRQAALDLAVEEGVREHDQLITSQQYGYSAAAESNPPLKLPPTFLPRAVARLLPRLSKDLQGPRLLAFNEFDHSRRGLALKTVEFDGETVLPSGAAGRAAVRGPTAYRLREREGLVSEPTDVYVDSTGEVITVVSGPFVLTACTPGELRSRFDARIAVAEKAIADLQREYDAANQRFRRP